ncbi:unnamed protein product [Closterium sp. NIES-64]|nr:unnamed protein product [Closterium sp. NIES-64]
MSRAKGRVYATKAAAYDEEERDEPLLNDELLAKAGTQKAIADAYCKENARRAGELKDCLVLITHLAKKASEVDAGALTWEEYSVQLAVDLTCDSPPCIIKPHHPAPLSSPSPSPFPLPPYAFPLPPSALPFPPSPFHLTPSPSPLPRYPFPLPPSALPLPPSPFRLTPSPFLLPPYPSPLPPYPFPLTPSPFLLPPYPSPFPPYPFPLPPSALPLPPSSFHLTPSPFPPSPAGVRHAAGHGPHMRLASLQCERGDSGRDWGAWCMGHWLRVRGEGGERVLTPHALYTCQISISDCTSGIVWVCELFQQHVLLDGTSKHVHDKSIFESTQKPITCNAAPQVPDHLPHPVFSSTLTAAPFSLFSLSLRPAVLPHAAIGLLRASECSHIVSGSKLSVEAASRPVIDACIFSPHVCSHPSQASVSTHMTLTPLSDSSGSESSVPTRMAITALPDNTGSELRVEAADRPGLLMEIVDVLTGMSISVTSAEIDTEVGVTSAEIDTEGVVAKDVFTVSYHGGALDDEMTTLTLNALNYTLSRPDIEAEESY